jgi:hypothetical protein
MKENQILVEVRGGVAEVIRGKNVPKDVKVILRDYDNSFFNKKEGYFEDYSEEII